MAKTINNLVRRWEVVGVLLIIGFGTTLHFWFEWSNYWRPITIIAAVNESTWEHFKMAFWPSLIWGAIEYPYLRDEVVNFLPAKVLGLLTMPAVTMILFYGYTFLTGHHYLIADVAVFILSVISGQYVSYRVFTDSKKMDRKYDVLAAIVLVVMIGAFSLLSQYPPRNFLFRHPDSNEYGILSEYDH